MKQINKYICERLHINKDISSQLYTTIENLENES